MVGTSLPHLVDFFLTGLASLTAQNFTLEEASPSHFPFRIPYAVLLT